MNAIIDQVRAELETTLTSFSDARDARATALELVALIERLEACVVALSDTGTGTTMEEQLHSRAARDYSQLQQQLAPVRRAIADRSGLISMLRGKGHDLESTKQYVALASALDKAFQKLVNLLQFDTPDRQEIDLHDGYRISSGSATIGRLHFAPPKQNRGS